MNDIDIIRSTLVNLQTYLKFHEEILHTHLKQISDVIEKINDLEMKSKECE